MAAGGARTDYGAGDRRDFLVTATPGAGQDDLRAGPGRAGCWPGGWSTGSSWSARPITCAPNGPTPRPASAWCSTRPCATPRARCATARTATSPRMRRSPGGRPSTRPAPGVRRSLVDPRRDPPRRRRAVLGCGGGRGVRRGAPPGVADRDAVPDQARRADPVRRVRRPTATCCDRWPTTPTDTGRRSPTGSSGPSSSPRTPGSPGGGTAPAR